MSDQISPELFNRLVELAALEPSPEEAEYLRRELNNQLRSIKELEAIPLDETTPVASHGVSYTEETSPVARADIWQPYPNPSRILDGAPETDDGYIVVPEIPHQKLD